MSALSYLRIAQKMAFLSQEEHKLGACAVKSGRVLGQGFNQLNKHNKIVKKFFNYPTLHAEIASICRLHADDIRDSVIYVYRERKSGSPGLAKPCARCILALIAFGVKRVVYSTDTFPFYESWKVAA